MRGSVFFFAQELVDLVESLDDLVDPVCLVFGVGVRDVVALVERPVLGQAGYGRLLAFPERFAEPVRGVPALVFGSRCRQLALSRLRVA